MLDAECLISDCSTCSMLEDGICTYLFPFKAQSWITFREEGRGLFDDLPDENVIQN